VKSGTNGVDVLDPENVYAESRDDWVVLNSKIQLKLRGPEGEKDSVTVEVRVADLYRPGDKTLPSVEQYGECEPQFLSFFFFFFFFFPFSFPPSCLDIVVNENGLSVSTKMRLIGARTNRLASNIFFVRLLCALGKGSCAEGGDCSVLWQFGQFPRCKCLYRKSFCYTLKDWSAQVEALPGFEQDGFANRHIVFQEADETWTKFEYGQKDHQLWEATLGKANTECYLGCTLHPVVVENGAVVSFHNKRSVLMAISISLHLCLLCSYADQVGEHKLDPQAWFKDLLSVNDRTWSPAEFSHLGFQYSLETSNNLIGPVCFFLFFSSPSLFLTTILW
jgi:hypothetical protein